VSSWGASIQKERAGIGAMNMAVTIGAVLKDGRPQIMKLERHRISLGGPAKARRAVMTFQTHSENNRTA
jgi:hypothetical protein